MFHPAGAAHGSGDVDNGGNAIDPGGPLDALDIIHAVLKADEQSAFTKVRRHRGSGCFRVDRLHR